MCASGKTAATGCPVRIDNVLSEIDNQTVIREILAGLTADQKYISSRYFYDDRGSRLFEEITHLPEYYQTRTEKTLIRKAAPRMGPYLQNTSIVEIGSGDCSKISLLFDATPADIRKTIRYLPVDVSRAAIEKSAALLQSAFPDITIEGIVADFTTQLDCLPGGGKRLFCFFGSTIGNLSRQEGRRIISTIGAAMRPGDDLLLGLDRVKDIAVVEKAYNDEQGVTASFNRNILNVVNTITGTRFPPESFDHLAWYNPTRERIEMHLKARTGMDIICPHHDTCITVAAGETIHTENSHKFSREHIHEFSAAAGLDIETVFTDPREWFSLVHMRKPREHIHD